MNRFKRYMAIILSVSMIAVPFVSYAETNYEGDLLQTGPAEMAQAGSMLQTGPAEMNQVSSMLQTGLEPARAPRLLKSGMLGEDTLPESYRATTSSVKHQSYNNCWAFACAGAAENSFIKQSLADVSVDFSEWQLTYFQYNDPDDWSKANDVQRLVASDSTYIQPGKGDYYNIGGNPQYAIMAMSGWRGLVTQDKAPNPGNEDWGKLLQAAEEPEESFSEENAAGKQANGFESILEEPVQDFEEGIVPDTAVIEEAEADVTEGDASIVPADDSSEAIAEEVVMEEPVSGDKRDESKGTGDERIAEESNGEKGAGAETKGEVIVEESGAVEAVSEESVSGKRVSKEHDGEETVSEETEVLKSGSAEASLCREIDTVGEADLLGTGIPIYTPEDEVMFNPQDAILENARLYNSDDINPIKKAIMEYGSVTMGYHHDNQYFKATGSNPDKEYIYRTATESKLTANHAVLCIGWNDAYQSWLIKGSYGADYQYSNGGFYWIRYDEPTLAYIVAMQFASASEYQYNYHYDGTSSLKITQDGLLPKGSKIANMYQVMGPENTWQSIDAVNVGIYTAGLDYTAEIYASDAPMTSPRNGIKVASQQGTTSATGLYQLTFDEPAVLKVGAYFSVVITFNNKSARVFVDTDDDTGTNLGFRNHVESLQSFRYNPSVGSGGTWYDQAGVKRCFRIKALTNTVEAPSTYTVYWCQDDGEIISKATASSTATPSYTGSNPTKEKDAQYTYTFTGWKIEKRDSIHAYIGYAQYSKAVNYYTVIFQNYTKKELKKYSAAYGSMPVPPEEPERKGYTFISWGKKLTAVTGDVTYIATFEKDDYGGGGPSGGGGGGKKKTVSGTFSPNWFADAAGTWRIKNSQGQIVTNAWLCDDVITANGRNVWYLLQADGSMLAAGLVQDLSGNFYSLETTHNGYFGMLRYVDGWYDCNGQQVYLQFSQKHDGSFGAVINSDGLAKLRAIYGVTPYGIGNNNIVSTASF